MASKRFRQGGAKHAAVEVGQGNIADAAAADIGMQHFHAAGGKFVGEDRALIAHPRGNLRGFGAGRRGHIHHALAGIRRVAIGKQGS